MRAATIVDGRIEVRDHPDPQPGAGEVLVRVRAAGLNNADLLQAKGFYPAPPGVAADIPGMEVAGEVVAVGPNAYRFQPGHRVMAVIAGGGQAELAVVHERTLIPVPDTVDWPQAGGFPETFTTAHDALFTQCRLGLGERLLVSGGAGGVGTAAVQLGVAAGAHVTASVRNAGLRSDVAALGAEVVDPADFVGAGPFDVVLELIGAPNLPGDLEALRVGGRIVVIGVGAGAQAEVNLLSVMAKRASICGSTLRARPLEGKAAAAMAVEHHVVPMLASGRITVPVFATYPLDDVAAAYERFAAGGKLGKVVITL
ncbi:MAG: NADPH:quinone reductase [Acidimicrobiaceae bacterium]|jgi:NADPH:quinone reductase-like Zn-dependent oxidoreductase|nr:NADPH:quinone reductase [Acidimicrobiaceae bacterium]